VATTFSEAISRAPLRTFSVVTFAICMLVLTVDGVDAQLLGIVAPKVIEAFGTDRGTFGIAMSAALVGFGLGSWGGGWLGDTVGRRWSLAIATVVFSLGTIGASTSADVWQMAAWRLVSGLGFGSAYANAIALAGEWLPDRWRPVGVTTLSVGTPAGGFVIAALAPSLDAAFGWRGTFMVVGAATLVVVILIVFLLRDSPSFLLAKGRSDAAHAAARRVIDGEIALVPEVVVAGSDGTSTGVFATGNERLNLGVGITFAAAALCAYAMLSWATTFLTAEGFSFDQAAYAVSVGGLTSVGASIAAGLLVQWLGSRLVMATISAALLATFVALALVLEGITGAPDGGDVMTVTVLYGLSAAIFSAGIACLYALMTHAYPPSCRSAGIGFGIFVGRIGAVAATGLGGWLIDQGAGSLIPFFAVLAVAAVLMAAAPLIIEADRHVPPARRRALAT
jgi:AAHS family 4-hydroxybenzoate transporter-like MFS transporter